MLISGVNAMSRGPRWTKESIVAALRERQARKLSLAFVNMPGGLLQAAVKQFGSYAKALDAVGLDYDNVRLHRWWTKESIVEEIRKLRAAGVEMSDKGIKSKSLALRGAIRSHFGSLAEAMEAARVPYQAPKYLSKLEAFDTLQGLQRSGADLSASAMKQRDHRLYAALR